MAQFLPAKQQYEFENSQEYLDLEEKIANLQGKTDTDSVKRRNVLYAQRRTLLIKELRKWQRLQPNKLKPRGVEIAALDGYHRSIFGRTRFLMPERDRLGSGLLEVTYLHSPAGIAALCDLIVLYLKETEIDFRPGLEPEKCSYSIVKSEQKLKLPCSSNRPAYNWRHIYDCYKANRTAEYSFTKLCFHYYNWIFNEIEWEYYY